MWRDVFVSMRPSAAAAVFVVAWSVAGPPAAFGQTPVPARLSLAEAVALAQARNPQLVAARSRVDAADADRVAAGKRPNPALSVDSAGYPAFETTKPGYWRGQEFTVRIDQELELAGRRRLRTAVADAARQAAALTVDDQARQLALEVKRAYLAVVLAQADRAVAQASQDEIDRVIGLNQARFAQGEISGADVRRLQVERLRFVEDVFAADLAVRNARSALLALLDAPRLDQPLELTDGLKVPTAGGDVALTAAGPAQADRVIAQALAQRPDLQGAKATQAQADTTTRLQRALRTPNLTLGGGYQNNFGSDGVVIGVAVPVPFFNRNEGGIARAEAERRAADARLASMTLAVRLDVQRALNAVETNRARVAYIEREYLTNAQESRDIVLASYRLGVANLIDFLDAQRAFRDTQRIYNRALFDQGVSVFELAAADGRPEAPPEGGHR
jgi:cobalt-zinc-cadmium efflux system outer membrane protein